MILWQKLISHIKADFNAKNVVAEETQFIAW